MDKIEANNNEETTMYLKAHSEAKGSSSYIRGRPLPKR